MNSWGRSAVDASIPHLDPATTDTRSVRFSIQALRETASAHFGAPMTGMKNGFLEWSRVADALREAETAATYTSHKNDPGDEALYWYIATLHLTRARAIWAQQIAPSQTSDRV